MYQHVSVSKIPVVSPCVRVYPRVAHLKTHLGELMAKKKTQRQKARTISQKQKQQQRSNVVQPKASDVPKQAEAMRPVVSGGAVKKNPLLGDPLLLTVEHVCTLLNLSRSTVYRMAKSGKLPGRLTFGNQVRYHRPSLELWLQQLVKGDTGDDKIQHT